MSEEDQLKIINKSAQVGNAHRLLPIKNISNVAIETWEHCFVGNLGDAEAMKMEAFLFLWRRDDVKKMATIPFRGVAGNINQLIYLMADNRINRVATGLELTEWTNVLRLKEFDMDNVKAVGSQRAREATSDDIKRSLDKIVNFITTDYYADPTIPGKATDDYFKDCKKSRKAIDKVYKNAQLYLLEDLCPFFEDGAYISWEAVMKAVKRFYGKDECQETMVDRFKALRDVINSNKRMETKVGKFRELLRKFAVDSTDERDMIKGIDFPGDTRAFNTVPERYSAAFNTLFTFMVFDKCIPTERWESVQTRFHGFLKEPTYKNWHEKRPELYKIIDNESRRTKSAEIETQKSEHKINHIDSRHAGRKNKNYSERREKSVKNGDFNADLQKEALLRYKCKMCSRFAKRTVCHRGPFNGHSNCLYRKDGSKRRGREAIYLSDDESSEDEESSSEDENDGQRESEEQSSQSEAESNSENIDFIYRISEENSLKSFRDAQVTGQKSNRRNNRKKFYQN